MTDTSTLSVSAQWDRLRVMNGELAAAIERKRSGPPWQVERIEGTVDRVFLALPYRNCSEVRLTVGATLGGDYDVTGWDRFTRRPIYAHHLKRPPTISYTTDPREALQMAERWAARLVGRDWWRAMP